MILDTVVARRVKSIIIIDRHFVCLRPTADGPPTRAQIDLNMHHIMLLNLPRLVVFRTVKDQIARPQLILLQFNRQSVKLVALIPMPKLEAKVTLQVTHSLPHERATVEEERRAVQRVRLMPVALGIRHP